MVRTVLLRTYYPKLGQILVCDYATGFVPPEMVKTRPVIVISPSERHGRRLCTVVPISTTEPQPVEPWHVPLPDLKIPGWKTKELQWAKCDMLATVAFDRLDKPHARTPDGRVYHEIHFAEHDLAAVMKAVRSYLAV